jgi:hypothetical protein
VTAGSCLTGGSSQNDRLRLDSHGGGPMKSKAKRTAAKKRLKSKHQNLPKSPAAATRRKKRRAAKKAQTVAAG